MKQFISNHWKKIVFIMFTVFCIPHIYIYLSTFQNSYSTITQANIIHSSTGKYNVENVDIAIVFGAAARENGPSDAFADRLDMAYDLYTGNHIQKILISGDNGNANYNEPETGKKYLMEKGVPEKNIVLDYAGFRTYDTCVRANKIFGIEKAYLVTQRFHLPRAIFTCQENGIESIGVSSSVQKYSSHWKNIVRETLAQQKAFYEVLFFPHDPKFLGDQEFIKIL